MSGAAVAYGTPLSPGNAGMNFDMTQEFEISFDKPTVKACKLTIEGRVIGALRSSCKGGCAEESGSACVSANGGGSVVSIAMPGHSVSNGENLSINDHEGPTSIVLNAAGNYVLSQNFHVQASMPKCGLTVQSSFGGIRSGPGHRSALDQRQGTVPRYRQKGFRLPDHCQSGPGRSEGRAQGQWQGTRKDEGSESSSGREFPL